MASRLTTKSATTPNQEIAGSTPVSVIFFPSILSARSSYPELDYSNRLLWVDEGQPLSLHYAHYARPTGLYGSPNVKVRVS